MTHRVVETLEQFHQEIETFSVATAAEFKKRGLQLSREQIRPDEFRFALIAPNGQPMQVNTVWYNAREKKAEYCEGVLRQHPPKDIV